MKRRRKVISVNCILIWTVGMKDSHPFGYPYGGFGRWRLPLLAAAFRNEPVIACGCRRLPFTSLAIV
jgi:hypothetical protein